MLPRIEIVRQIDDIRDQHCEPCSVKRTDRYCIEECSFGKDLQLLGYKLTELTNQKRLNKKPLETMPIKKIEKTKETIKIKWYQDKLRSDVNVSEKLTKEKYLELKDQKLTDTQIIKQFYLNNVTFYKMKKDWGLKGVKNNKVETSFTVEEKPVTNEINDLKSQLEKATNLLIEFKELVNKKNESIEQLNKTIAEKTTAFEIMVGTSEKLIEENELLKQEIEELKAQLKEPAPVTTPFYYELEEQNIALRQCLKMVL